MAPDFSGNVYLPFVDLIRLEKVDERTFRSIATPFAPGGALGPGRTYGGHVFMQAAWAASQTVEDGLLLHNVTGNFLLPGLINIPFVYKVHIIRDGRSYSTRIVNVTQARNRGICFTCICSFHRPETSPLAVQDDNAHPTLSAKYAIALTGKSPADHEEIPGMDVPWYWKRRRETGENDRFPGLEMRKVDMSAYNSPRHPLDRRQLMFYRPLGPIPDEENPNMHLCAHLYASDRNSLYIVANHFDIGDLWTQMGSLVHSVTFHGDFNDLRFGPAVGSSSFASDNSDEVPKGKFFCKEDWGDRAEAGRAMFHSRLWSPEGKHIATVSQDGMIRVTKAPKATEEEKERLTKRMSGWKEREKL